jgi:hypothetical protein
MEDLEIEERMRKLKKRGFITDSVREACGACSRTALHIYRIAGRGGGRDIHWCLACDMTKSFRRNADDLLIEDPDFDLDAFLEQNAVTR